MLRKRLLLIGFPFFIILFIYLFAFFQLNLLAMLLQTNSQVIGIQKERGEISRFLKENNTSTRIIVTDQDSLVFSLATTMSGKNAYATYVLKMIPQSFVMPHKQSSSMLLMDNALFIIDVKSSDLEAISPYIGYSFVKEHFSNEQIKFSPKVRVLDKIEYQKAREELVNMKIQNIENELIKITEAIEQISTIIHTDKTMIALNQETIFKAQSLKEKQKKSVVRKKLDKEITVSRKNIDDWNRKLQIDKKQLGEYQKYSNFYKQQKQKIFLKKAVLPYESGVFEAEKSIKIVLGIPNTKGLLNGLSVDASVHNEEILAYYWGTLVHEYLHYTSYISKEKKLNSSFFEEGLTEYFARKIMDNNSTVVMRSTAYPLQVKIISEMTKKISEKEFEKIYFEKDEKRLEEVLDKTYGKGFYKNNQIATQTLEYTSDPIESLRIANDVMKRIGGEQLTESSLRELE